MRLRTKIISNRRIGIAANFVKDGFYPAKCKEFLSRVSPKISMGPDPTSEFSLSLGITPKEYAPEQILKLAESIAKKTSIRKTHTCPHGLSKASECRERYNDQILKFEKK